MSALHQIVAVYRDLKGQAVGQEKELEAAFSSSGLYSGLNRSYHPLYEDGDRLPPEIKNVARTVSADLLLLAEKLGRYYDIGLTQEMGNSTGMARVIMDDGTELFGGNPLSANALIFLENRLEELLRLMNGIPILDPVVSWVWSPDLRCWKTGESENYRTAKIQQPLVLHEGTDRHPPQTQLITVDKQVGTWRITTFSGAVPVSEKRTIVSRVSEILVAVRKARVTANQAEVKQFVNCGKEIFDYILAGISGIVE